MLPSLLGVLFFTGLAAQEPRLRFENMTKLTGTDQGFPSDTWYVFNRLRTDMNPKNLGHLYSYDDREVVRIHNDGKADLILQELELSDPSAFAFQKRDFENLPITIKPGDYYDLFLVFLKSEGFWREAEGVYQSNLVIETNAGTQSVLLSGHYQLRPEGSWEPDVSEIDELFGFSCGVPAGKLPMVYPTRSAEDPSDYGPIVVSEYWEQADPAKPVNVMFIYALGGGGHPNLKFLDEKDEIVGGVDFQVNGRRVINGENVWVCQTVFPAEEDNPGRVVGASVDRVEKPFRLSISNRTTSGTGPVDPITGKPATLAFLFFPITSKRSSIHQPNDYMIAFDVVPVNGSHANGDFNDYMLYISNVRPKDGKPELDWASR